MPIMTRFYQAAGAGGMSDGVIGGMFDGASCGMPWENVIRHAK